MVKKGKKRADPAQPHAGDDEGKDDDGDEEQKVRDASERVSKRSRRRGSGGDQAVAARPTGGSDVDDTDSVEPSTDATGSAPVSSASSVGDTDSGWAPGQWESWKAHRAREEALNKKRQKDGEKKKTVQNMVTDFSKICQERGWRTYSYAAIRAHKLKVEGDAAEYNANPMTEADRARARALFEEHKNWSVATEKFNQETGRTMTRDALVQASRRQKLAAVARIEAARKDTSGNLHRWTDQEVQALKKYTNHKHKELASAYYAFTREMQASVPDYQPRQWIAFIQQLGLVRSAAVETGKTNVSVGRLWKSEKLKEFDDLAGECASKTALIGAAASRFGCTRAYAQQLYLSRMPLLRWQRQPGEQPQAVAEEEDTPIAGDDADRRPERRDDEDDDAEDGMPTTPMTSTDTTARSEHGEHDDESRAAAAIMRLGEMVAEPEVTRVLSDTDSVGAQVCVREQDVIGDTDFASTVAGGEEPSTQALEAELESGGSPSYEEEEKGGDKGDNDVSADERWLATCGYVPHVPWIDEPSTPTPSHLGEDEEQTYSPRQRAYDVEDQDDEPSGEHGNEETETSARSTVRASQWSQDEGRREAEEEEMKDTSTRDGWISINAGRGIRVDPLPMVPHYFTAGPEVLAFEVDEAVEAAERDADVNMNQGHAYDRLLQEWAQCLHDGIDIQPPEDVKHPELTWRRMTEMAVMIYALNDYTPYRIALLRHFGRREKDVSSFGECYGDKCCLGVNFGARGMTWTVYCRHWLFFAKEEVYLDRFRSVEDYRLAMALACALQAVNQVRMKRQELEEKRVNGEPRPYGVNIDVISVTTASKFFDRYVRALARPYARILLDCMVVIIPGTADYGSMASQYREATRPSTFGTLWTGRHGEKLANAVLCRYDGQDFWLANTSIPVASKLKFVHWVAEERLQTYSRRCGVLEACAGMPKVRQLALREPSIVPRHANVVRLIENGAQYAFARTQLDDAQFKALDMTVKHIGIIPIRGPFGCGKTRLIASIIAVQLEAYPHFRIFVTSETNAAIDEDLRRLVDDGAIPVEKIVRLGEMPRNAPEKYRKCLLSERVAEERKALREKGVTGPRAEKYLNQFEREQLEQAAVVFATTATFGREQYASLQAQVVINDEGGQTTEASLLQAIRSQTMTLIPIGDPNQLRGRIEVPEGKVERYEAGDRRHKMNWSVIEALAYSHDHFPGATLTAQYRSHPSISRWLHGFYEFEMVERGPRSTEYLRRVVVGVEESEALPPVSAAAGLPAVVVPPQEVVMGSRRLALISCDNAGRSADGSPANMKEENRVEVWKVIELVLQITREREQEAECKKSVIVVTPYNKQKEKIEKELEGTRSLWKDAVDVSVHTIDSCQGKEADVGIVSMVRVHGLGFLAENKSRTLVALSRARDYQFVLARRAAFDKDPWWQWLYASALDSDVDAACVNEMLYSDEAERALKDQRRLRELCVPLRDGPQRADVVKSGAQDA